MLTTIETAELEAVLSAHFRIMFVALIIHSLMRLLTTQTDGQSSRS
jgi:hypothetical protein